MAVAQSDHDAIILPALGHTVTVTKPDTSTVSTSVTGDPRFGVNALQPAVTTVFTKPSGNSYTKTTTTAATFSPAVASPDPANLASLSVTQAYAAPSLTPASFVRTYTRATNTIVDTYPPARTSWPQLTVTQTLDANGRVASLALPGRNLIHYVYDTLGRRTMTWSAEGTVADCNNPAATPSPASQCRRSIATYDATSGFLATISDGVGSTTSFTADAVGRPLSLALPSLDGTSSTRTLTMTFDGNGNMATVTAPNLIGASPPNPHYFTFDGVDRPTTYTAPDIAPTYTGIPRSAVTHYNIDGQPDLITPPAGGVVHLYYEGDAGVGLPTPNPNTGRPKRISHALGTIDLSYGSSGTNTGRLTSVAGPGTTTFTLGWDGAERLTTWSGPFSHYVGKSVDNYLRPSKLRIDGLSPFATYSYDSLNALSSVALSPGATPLTISRETTSNRITTTSLAGTYTATDSYDSVNGFGEVMGYSAKYGNPPPPTAQYSVTFLRDGNGRIIQKNETSPGLTKILGYAYFAGGALHEVNDVSGGWPGTTLVTYAYDGDGNRLTRMVGAGPAPTTAAYDSQDRLVAYGGTNAYTYNANGQLTSKTVGSDVTTYSYDNLGNLLNVTKTGTGAFNIDYVVDGLGRRIAKKVGGVMTRAWIYDGARIIAEWDTTTTTPYAFTRFVYATKTNVPDAMIRTSHSSVTTTYRIISDHLGSVRMVVNLTTGVVDQQINYDDDGFGGVLASSTGAGDFQPFGFAGGHYDYQTQLIRFGARDYDPEVGRWTAKDPSRFEGGDFNLFAYAKSDPVNYLDPNGRFGTWALFGGPVGWMVVGTIVVMGTIIVVEETINASQHDGCSDPYRDVPIDYEQQERKRREREREEAKEDLRCAAVRQKCLALHGFGDKRALVECIELEGC